MDYMDLYISTLHSSPSTLVLKEFWIQVMCLPKVSWNNPNSHIVEQAPSCAQLQVAPAIKYKHIDKFAMATQPEALCKFVDDKLHLDPSVSVYTRLVKKYAHI